jgi:hypothetical protein
MRPPCVTRHRRHGLFNTTVSCGDPISHLCRNSILAYWTTNTNPAGRSRPGPGVPITVDGRRGTWLVQTGSAQAPSLGEIEVITLVVPIPGARDSWYQLTALLRGPDTAGLEAQLKALLRSTRWHG